MPRPPLRERLNVEDVGPQMRPFTSETVPEGLSIHAPGAKADATKIRAGLVLLNFAHALQAVAEIGTFGARKYSDNGWKQVPAGIDRYTDALLRHLLAEGTGEYLDQDSGLLHAAHCAWNALARLELMLNEELQPANALDQLAYETLMKDAQWTAKTAAQN
jgi:hypothetical protein